MGFVWCSPSEFELEHEQSWLLLLVQKQTSEIRRGSPHGNAVIVLFFFAIFPPNGFFSLCIRRSAVRFHQHITSIGLFAWPRRRSQVLLERIGSPLESGHVFTASPATWRHIALSWRCVHSLGCASPSSTDNKFPYCMSFTAAASAKHRFGSILMCV